MTISYNWLSEYLPKTVSPEQLSTILTSIGLEVESLEKVENFRGGLAGLVVGEVVELSQHPNADKLKLTKVNTGGERIEYCMWCKQCCLGSKSSGCSCWNNYLSQRSRSRNDYEIS